MISFLIPKTFFVSSVFMILLVKFCTKLFAAAVSNYYVGDIFSGIPLDSKYSYVSPVGLKSLLALEATLYNSLAQYAVGKPSAISEQLQLYLADYEDSTLKFISNSGKKDQKSAENPSWNPIVAFRTVWRFVKYLRRWAEPGVSMPKNQANKFKDISMLISHHYNASHGPTESDLEDAKMSLVNLVETYTMDIQHFAAGNISGKGFGVGLTAAQCIEMGWFTIRHGFYVTGVEFMEAALDKVEKETGDVSVKLSKAREHVKAAYIQHDEAFDKTSKWNTDFFTTTLGAVSARTERIRRRDVVPRTVERKLYEEDLYHKYRFQTVCKGTYPQEKNETRFLFCWYEHQVDLTFTIGPLKVEFVAPQVVKFHQLISESAISELRNSIPANFRESTQGSLKDFTFWLGAFTTVPYPLSTARLIADAVGRATGFQYTTRNFQELEISVHTPGGHFNCHGDLTPSEIYNSRIATFLVYLSQVEQGGETGFCKRGVLVKPEVGSGLLYYNMLSSGEMDVMSEHCSCPVVFGEKWVSTAHIYMGPQSHLQCNQDPSKKLEYLVNKKSAGKFM